MPKLGEFFFGKSSSTEQMPLFSPEQMAFLNKILGAVEPGTMSGIDYLTKMVSGDQGSMNAFTDPYMRQFQEQTIPSISERFANLDAQKSSAFGQSLSQAGAGLQEQLAGLRANLKNQALSQLQGYAGMGLGQQYQNIVKPGTSGMFAGMAAGAGSAIGSAAGSAMMGGMGFGGAGGAGLSSLAFL